MAELVSPLLFFGDGVQARMVVMSPIKINENGVPIREIVMLVREELLEYIGVDISKVGVNKYGKNKGPYIKKEYSAEFIMPPIPFFVARPDRLIIILCGFDGSETDLTRLPETHSDLINNLHQRITMLKGQIGTLLEENGRLRTQFKGYLKDIAEMNEIQSGGYSTEKDEDKQQEQEE